MGDTTGNKFPMKKYLLILLYLLGTDAFAHNPDNFSASVELNKFINSLEGKKVSAYKFAFDSELKNIWHYVPRSREGVPLKELNKAQKNQLFNFLKSVLSQKGLATAEMIRGLEAIIQQEEWGFISRDPEAYYLEVFGEPSLTNTWAVSFEGHHLSLNYILKGDEIISFSPMFFGANPATVNKDYGVGPKKGTRVLGQLETPAFELIKSFDKAQKKIAIISNRAPGDVRAGGKTLVPTYQKAGISSDKLNVTQKKLLLSLIQNYLDFLPEQNILEINLKCMDASLFFSWAGSTTPNKGHHYVIEHPRFLIELNNSKPGVSDFPANHIHALLMVRN